MKKLQTYSEEQWHFQAEAHMSGVLSVPESAEEVILLLHGLNERGRRIFRKLMPYLPQKAVIIAPNGPFPVPKSVPQQISMGFAWYYYDREEKRYLVPQDLSRGWLKELIKIKNPNGLPITIIGFSQGGYLAPLIAQDIPLVKMVIGIGCEFREKLFHGPINFALHGIHGEKDEVISKETSLADAQRLQKSGIECGWHLIPDAGHEITPQVGAKVKALLEEHGKRSL